MKSKFQLSITVCLFVLTVMAISCKKENNSQPPAVTQEEAQAITEENAAAESEYDDVSEIALSTGADVEAIATANTTGGSSTEGNLRFRLELFTNLEFKLGPCTQIQVFPDDLTFPKKVVINYGDGCICRDGKFRKGAIEITLSGLIRQHGSSLTVTLKNYFVNRMHIEGSKTITNLSEGGVVKFSVSIEGGKVTLPNGRGFSYEGTKVVTQIEGGETTTLRDDVFSIEGSSKTEYANGTVVTKNTETALIKPVACPWIVKGILDVTVNDKALKIDFGTGECDNKALLIWATGQAEIRLP